MSTSLFVGALDSETLHFAANGAILQRHGALLADSLGSVADYFVWYSQALMAQTAVARIECEGNDDMSYHCE
jgi:hypothetical protein